MAPTAASRALVSRRLASSSLIRTSPAAAHAARGFQSSSIAKGGQSSATSSSSAADEEYTHEGFTSPLWGYTLVASLAGLGLYRLSTLHSDPHPSRASSSGRSAPGNESEDNRHPQDESNEPWLTRYIAYWTTPSSVWKERNDRHLELAREKAEEKLFLQDAERPPVHRLRFPQTFEMGSPHAVGVGSQTNLTDLKIKKSNE